MIARERPEKPVIQIPVIRLSEAPAKHRRYRIGLVAIVDETDDSRPCASLRLPAPPSTENASLTAVSRVRVPSTTTSVPSTRPLPAVVTESTATGSW